jgi:hypothetical protein
MYGHSSLFHRSHGHKEANPIANGIDLCRAPDPREIDAELPLEILEQIKIPI